MSAPSIVVALIVVGAILSVLMAVAARRASLAGRLIVVIAAVGYAFITLVGVQHVDWSSVGRWAALAAVLVEAPKVLHRVGLRDGAIVLTVGSVLIFGLPVAVQLSNGTFEPAAGWFSGIILGLAANCSVVGFRSVASFFEEEASSETSERPRLRRVA